MKGRDHLGDLGIDESKIRLELAGKGCEDVDQIHLD
jgi:hypothetical protein